MNLGSILSGLKGALSSLGGALNTAGGVLTTPSSWIPSAINAVNGLPIGGVSGKNFIQQFPGSVVPESALLNFNSRIFGAPQGNGQTVISAPQGPQLLPSARANQSSTNFQGGVAGPTGGYPASTPSPSAAQTSPSAFNQPGPSSSPVSGRAYVPQPPVMPAATVQPKGLSAPVLGNNSGGGSSPASPTAVPLSALIAALAPGRAAGYSFNAPEQLSTGGAPKRRLSQEALIARAAGGQGA